MESDLRSLLGKMREDIRAEAEAGVPKPIPSGSDKNCLHGKVKTALDREGKEVHSSIFHFGSVSSSVFQFDSVQRDLQNNTQDADVCSYDEIISDDSPCEEGKAPYHPIHAPFSPRPQFMRFRRASWSRRRASAKNGDAPYDPEVNLLSQRPKFLRYCPKRRLEFLHRGDVARLRRSAGISSPQNSQTSSQSNEIRSAESRAFCNKTDSPSSKVGEATPTSKLVSDAPFQFRASDDQFEFRVNDKELSNVCDPVSDIHSNNPMIPVCELASDLPSDSPVQKIDTNSALISSTTETQQIVNTQLHVHDLNRQKPHSLSHIEATQSPSSSRPRFKILFLFSLMLLSGLVASIFILADRFEDRVVPEISSTLQPNEGSNISDSLSCENSMCMVVEDYLWSEEGILHNQSADLLENDNSDPYTAIVKENFGSGGVHGMHDSLDVEKVSPASPETLLELQKEPEEKVDEFGTLDTEHQLEYHNDVDALFSYTEQQNASDKLQPRSFDDGWLCSSYWEDEVLLICRSKHLNVNSEEAGSITVDASNSNSSLFFSNSCTENDVSDASRVSDDSSNIMSFQPSLSSEKLIGDASLQEVWDGPQASSMAYRIQDFCTSFKLVLITTGVILLSLILFVWSKLCKRTSLTGPEEEKYRATEEVKRSRPRCKTPVGANENKPIYKATVEFRNVNTGFRASAGAKESRSSPTASAEAKKISSRAPAEAKESLISFTSPGEPKESKISFTSPAKSRLGFTSLAEEKENRPSVATPADTKGKRSSTVSAERKKSGIHMSQDQLIKNNVQEKPATSRSPAPYGSFLTQVADRDRPALTPVRRSSRIKSKSEK